MFVGIWHISSVSINIKKRDAHVMFISSKTLSIKQLDVSKFRVSLMFMGNLIYMYITLKLMYRHKTDLSQFDGQIQHFIPVKV